MYARAMTDSASLLALGMGMLRRKTASRDAAGRVRTGKRRRRVRGPDQGREPAKTWEENGGKAQWEEPGLAPAERYPACMARA
jgi:hypothetical protein